MTSDQPSTETLGVVVVPEGFSDSPTVGGLSPILRHALAFQAAGVDAVVVVEGTIPEDPRLRIPVLAALRPHARALLARADVTSHRDVPRHLAEAADLVAHEVVAIGDGDARLFACQGSRTAELADSLRRGAPIASTSSLTLRGGVSPEFVVHARDDEERRRATRALLLSLRKPTSGYFERLYMRPLSMHLTHALLGTSVTPNQVTGITFALGLYSAYLVGVPDEGANRAGALVHLAMRVVDCVDGELARLRYQGSRLGSWLDTVGDAVAMTAFVAAIGHRLEGVGSPYATWAYVGAVAWVVVQLFQWRAAYVTDTGGTVQTIAWGHRAAVTNALERFVARVELLLRIDAISTYYGLLVLAGAYAPLAVGHTVVSIAAIAYYATQTRVWRRART